jgi:long-subunit acyl-CoA synthetase (AMP-forming)
LTLYSFEEVIFKGREAVKNGNDKIIEPKPDDVVALSYTSGTTGEPKGV